MAPSHVSRSWQQIVIIFRPCLAAPVAHRGSKLCRRLDSFRTSPQFTSAIWSMKLNSLATCLKALPCIAIGTSVSTGKLCFEILQVFASTCTYDKYLRCLYICPLKLLSSLTSVQLLSYVSLQTGSFHWKSTDVKHQVEQQMKHIATCSRNRI